MCLAMNRGLENNFLCTEIHVLSALKKYKAKVCIVLFGCVNSFVHSFIQKTLTGKKKKTLTEHCSVAGCGADQETPSEVSGKSCHKVKRAW